MCIIKPHPLSSVVMFVIPVGNANPGGIIQTRVYGIDGLQTRVPGFDDYVSYRSPTVSGHRCCICGVVTGVEQVVSAELLVLAFSHNLMFDEHVKISLTICIQHSYFLKCLKGQCFPSKELHTVFCL